MDKHVKKNILLEKLKKDLINKLDNIIGDVDNQKKDDKKTKLNFSNLK
jgi:hypothetical protein